MAGRSRPRSSICASTSSAESVVQDFSRWDRVRDKLAAGQMPPKQAKQPDDRARQQVVNWIDATWKSEARRNDGDPGVVLARRLSNAEYDYTIHDLTGVDIRPAREFPVDPANQAGFDNSGESLTMSSALLTKYLQAARKVADHMYLTPEGFEFAPHPMLVETDREKYCIQQIVAFYDRQATDFADYFYAAWVYKHRSVLGKPRATLADIAAYTHVSAKYLATVWDALEKKEEIGPMAKLQAMWNALPVPKGNQPDLARDGSTRDARVRRADAQRHHAEVCEPGRQGLDRRHPAVDELEKPDVRDAPPRLRTRRAAGRGRAAAGRGQDARREARAHRRRAQRRRSERAPRAGSTVSIAHGQPRSRRSGGTARTIRSGVREIRARSSPTRSTFASGAVSIPTTRKTRAGC